MTTENNIETMKQCLAQIRNLDGLENFSTSKALPQALFANLEQFFHAFDQFIDETIETEQFNISCQSGCSACCQYELARGVSTLEAIHIYHHVRSWPDIGNFYDMCGENMVRFQKILYSLVKRDGKELAPDDERIVEAHLTYNSQKNACAFLDLASGKCRIYPARPIVCRFFFNLSPASWCAIDHPDWQNREGRHINPPTEIKQLFSEINHRINIRSFNFLSGAFVTIAGDVMNGEPIVVK